MSAHTTRTSAFALQPLAALSDYRDVDAVHVTGSVACLGLVVWLWYVLFPSVRQLDSRSLGQGTEAPLADAPRSWSAATDRSAVGPGWVATKGFEGWRVLDLTELCAVAVVPPSLAVEFGRVRDWRAHGPYVALRTVTGRVLRIDVHSVNDELRRQLAQQLPAGCELTSLAARYLDSGEVPGRWGRAWQIWGFRFGLPRTPPSVQPAAAPTYDPTDLYASPLTATPKGISAQRSGTDR